MVTMGQDLSELLSIPGEIMGNLDLALHGGNYKEANDARRRLTIQLLFFALTKKKCPGNIPAKSTLPELRISASKYPELAANIRNAQRAGHPDVLTHGGEAVSDANRSAALHQPYRDFIPNIGRGLSRDEYPLASSLEGGAGAWVGHIPTAQQQAQGGLLRAMNLKPGDRYRVVIAP
jgi:hypothetical protein